MVGRGHDPVFWHEDRVALRKRRSSLRQLLEALWRHKGEELGVLLSLAVVASLIRTSRGKKVIEQLSKKVNEVGGMVRESSIDGLAKLGKTAGRLTRQRVDSGSEESDIDSPRAMPQEAALPSNPMLERLAGWFQHRMDAMLLGLLSYKLVLLVLYTMPQSYFFGVKRSFLRWASTARTFRLYLRSTHLLNLSFVMATGLVVRYSPSSIPSGRVARWQVVALMNTVLTYCTTQLFELIRGDPEPLLHLEDTAADRDLKNATPPPLLWLQAATWPLRQISPPIFLGADDLPLERRKLLFVGNHIIWGLDVPLLLHGLYEQLGIWLRPLGEHSWFSVPIVGELVFFTGAIDGTRHNCDLLMEQGENILVYPGGARESWKRTTDKKYELLWADHHMGFAALAVRHGYTIIPVAGVGLEDIFEPVYDLPLDKIMTAGGLLARPGKGTSKAFDKGAKFPMIRPQLDQAQRSYYRLCPPIVLDHVKGQETDTQLVRDVRDRTRSALEDGIQGLLSYRETDPDRYVRPRRRPAPEGDDSRDAATSRL